MEEVVVQKLVHGGQGLATAADGRKIFVWNALPGEKVQVHITKKRKDYAEGVAENILEASPERTTPKDEAYLSTSPWQIMTFAAENKYKQQILAETFLREKVKVPRISFIAGSGKAAPVLPQAESGFTPEGAMENPLGVFHYRNKMEYSFYGDENGLHLALFNRASHSKRIVQGSSIARPEIDQVAQKICSQLMHFGVRASQLKTIVVRCSVTRETVVALFVKGTDFPEIPALKNISKGLVVYYSNPKSPASIVTKKLYQYGDITLTDKVLDRDITYDVNSFFQVNIPIFEQALQTIKSNLLPDKKLVDMYAGVGTIGLCVGAEILVELDEHNIVMAHQNVGKQNIKIVQASIEKALDYIAHDTVVIFDPPRAGLHAKVIDRIHEALPPQIVYLSCNPVTQARDIALLGDNYQLKSVTGYNFFPRTPHIESLAILERTP